MTAYRYDCIVVSMQYERIGMSGSSDVARRGRGGRAPHGARRALRWVAIAVVGALALSQVVDLVTAGPTVGHWRSAEAKSRYETAYAETLSALPPPDEVRQVATRFGEVRVTMWRGAAPGPPVLLIPGRSSGAPMWAANLPDWIGRRTVYALDPIGDAGLSAQSLPLTSPEDQAEWIAEAVRGLGQDRVHVVGHSFGGANAAMLALRHPELVATLTLLEPVVVISPLPASIYLWSAVLLLPAPQSWKDEALARIGGTTADEVRDGGPMARMIDAAGQGYAAALPTPRRLTDEEWSSLPMPVRVDIGGASELAGGAASVERLRGLLPEAEVTLWPGASHSLPMERRAQLDPALLELWAAHS